MVNRVDISTPRAADKSETQPEDAAQGVNIEITPTMLEP